MGGPCATFITGFFVDMFGAKSEMTIPIICIVKSIIDIPLQFMIFGQYGNFWVAISGLILEYFLAKGWTSSAMLIL